MRQHTISKTIFVVCSLTAAVLLGCQSGSSDKATEGKPPSEASGEAAGDESHEHANADEGKNDHGAMNHGAMDHGAMDHGAMDHGAMDHGAMDHEGKGHAEPAAADTVVHQPGAKVGDRTICPVMGNEFEVTEESSFAEHEGQKVYFCCSGCDAKFAEDPAGQLEKLAAKVDAANAGDANGD